MSDTLLGMGERLVRRDEEIREATKALIARQAKGKALAKMKLSKLMAKRRLEHVIPDAAFACQPAFDWVHIWQCGPRDSSGPATFEEGGTIIMPETSRDWAIDESPRGVLVKAGPQALDELRTNGIDIGHIVRFVRLAPYRIVVDTFNGRDLSLLVMRSGSVTASEDLEQAQRAGLVRLDWDPTADEGRGKHVWVDTKTKKIWDPRKAWVPADYG